jgi:hypothetical protein
MTSLLDIGDSNTHYAPSFDPLIDVAHPKMLQMRQNGTIQIAREPDIDHYDNAFANKVIGYGSTFIRDYYIPNDLEPERSVLWLPSGISGGGTSIAGGRFWTSMIVACNLANGSPAFTTAVAHGLGAHPTVDLRMRAIATGLPNGTILSAASGTTGTLSAPYTGTTGTYNVLFRGAGICKSIERVNAAMAAGSGVNRVVGILMAIGTNDISGEGNYSQRLAAGIADIRATAQGMSDSVPLVINSLVPAYAASAKMNSAFIKAANEQVAKYIPNSAYASPYAGVYPPPHNTELTSNNGGRHYNAPSIRDYAGRDYVEWKKLATKLK